MNTNTDSPERQRALNIQLLGRFHVSHGDRSVPEGAWRLRNAEHLVKLIALSSALSLHREQIIDQLWPELDLASASNNLRYALYVARRVLATVTAEEVLVRRGEQIALQHPRGVVVDATRFEKLANNALRSRDPDDLYRAIDSYAGELLPADRYEDWTVWRREALRSLYFTLLIDLAGIESGRGNHQDAIDALQQVIDVDPAHEEAHVELMRTFARRGHRQHALRQYALLQTRLREELDIDPDPASQRLYQDILTAQLDGDSEVRHRENEVDSPEALPAPRRHNLPFSLTSFVGRKREIDNVHALLNDHRLVTLTGIGGSGKTRLAVEATRHLIDEYPDGVWMIDLASVGERNILLQKVATVLEIPDQPGQPLIDVLVDVLTARRLLILLDNCEHLVAECSEFASRILQACAHVRILATSRERLHIDGERTVLVHPLELPHDLGPTTPENLSGVESIQLFLERAALAQPAFKITMANAAAVRRICEKLDGIPLAIELAAARLSVLTPDELASRLDDVFAVLTDGKWSGVPRHRTLRATLDWSYGLLTEDEQTLFRWMSVFNGGCTLEACHTVCDWQADDSNVTLNRLSQLVDKSLVFVDVAASHARYQMLTVVRQYAAEQLNANGEASLIQRRHAEYYLEMAESVEPVLLTHNHAAGIQTLESDLDNLRSSLLWFQSDNPFLALRLAGALGRFWWARGYHKEGTDWLCGLLARNRTSADSEVRSKVLAWAFLLTFRQGNHDVAHSFVQEQLALARETNDSGAMAWSLLYLSMLVGEGGDYQGELRLLEEALTLFRQINDTNGVAHTLNSLGEAARYEGDFDRAIELFEETLNLWHTLGDRPYYGLALHNLGRAVLSQGDTQRAARLFTEGLSNFHQMGTLNGIALCLSGLAGVAVSRRDFELAARLIGAASALRGELGAVEESLDHHQTQAAADAARHSLGPSRFESAWDAGRTMPLNIIISEAMAMRTPVPDREPALTFDVAPLTRRERDVAALVAEGLTNVQIADRLGMAKRTTDTHVSRILRKLRFETRQQIAKWANRGRDEFE